MSISLTSELESSLMSFAVAWVQAPHLEDIVKSRRARGNAAPRGFPAGSRVLARLASLAQIGELARGLILLHQTPFQLRLSSKLSTCCWLDRERIRKKREKMARGAEGDYSRDRYYSRKYVKSPLRLVIHWYLFLVKDFFIVFSLLSKL